MGTLLLFAVVIRFVFSRIALLNGYGEAIKWGASFLRHPGDFCVCKGSIINIETFSDILVGTEDRYSVTFFEKEVGREFQYNFAISLDR